jgi:hypothetical protein
VFCNSCSSNGSSILLFGITDDVRVCDRCFQEIPAENLYVGTFKPLLLRGENFKKFIMMGMSTKIVKLRMSQDETTLLYDDQSRAEPTIIPLSEVIKLNMTSLKAFELSTDSKSYEFEADSSSVQKQWMEALKVTIERSKEPNLRQKVDNERRLKVEAARRSSVKGGSGSGGRADRTNTSAKVRGKYS